MKIPLSILYFFITEQGSQGRSEVRCKEIKRQYKYNFYIPTHYYITYIATFLHPTPCSKLTVLPKSIPFLVVAVCTY